MAAIHKKVFTSQKGLRSTGGPDLLKWGLPGGGVKSAKVAPIPYVYFPPEVHVWSYTGVDLPRYRVGFFIKKKQKGAQQIENWAGPRWHPVRSSFPPPGLEPGSFG